MGSLTLAYPSIAGKTTQEQLESMRRYLCSVTEQLNLADWSAKATLTEISQAIDADNLSEAEKKTTLSGYGALKALIIKTADFAAANSETWSTKLSGSYVAISDFGKYLEKTQLTIEGNSVGIKQLYDYTAGVNNQFSVNSQQYIKTGLLYYKDAVPVYGVGVGNIETTVTDGGENVIDRTKNELVTVTPDRVSFWQDGQEVAYLSDKKLHFPSGTLEAAGAVLSGKITAAADSTFGPWTISESSIYRTANEFGGSAEHVLRHERAFHQGQIQGRRERQADVHGGEHLRCDHGDEPQRDERRRSQGCGRTTSRRAISRPRASTAGSWISIIFRSTTCRRAISRRGRCRRTISSSAGIWRCIRRCWEAQSAGIWGTRRAITAARASI